MTPPTKFDVCVETNVTSINERMRLTGREADKILESLDDNLFVFLAVQRKSAFVLLLGDLLVVDGELAGHELGQMGALHAVQKQVPKALISKTSSLMSMAAVSMQEHQSSKPRGHPRVPVLRLALGPAPPLAATATRGALLVSWWRQCGRRLLFRA